MPTQRELERELVKKAVQRGMAPDQIKEAVIQFRQARGVTSAPVATEQPSNASAQPEKKGTVEYLKGAGKGVISTIKGASTLGENFFKGFGRLITPKKFEKSFGFEKTETSSAQQLQNQAESSLGLQQGTLTTPTNKAQKRGFVVEQIAETLLPIPGGAKAKAAAKIAGGAKSLLGRAGLEAAELAGKTAIQTGGDVKETGKAALTGGAFSVGGRALSALGGKIAPKLAKSAEASVSKALGPTTKAMKLQTEKVVPGLIKRGVVAPTRASLAKKVGANLEAATNELNRVIETIPPKARLSSKPVIEALQNAKSVYRVGEVAVEPRAIKAIDDMIDTVKSFGSEVSFESMRALRQILDTSVAKSKGFLLDEVGSFSVMAKREASNAIRKELAKTYPDLAKVNAEYSFWRNVDDILQETLTRTASQSKPIGEQILGAAGAVGGLATGGVAPAVAGYIVMSNLRKAVTSTGWRTAGAQIKTRLADALAAGNAEEISSILAKILEGATSK